MEGGPLLGQALHDKEKGDEQGLTIGTQVTRKVKNLKALTH